MVGHKPLVHVEALVKLTNFGTLAVCCVSKVWYSFNCCTDIRNLSVSSKSLISLLHDANLSTFKNRTMSFKTQVSVTCPSIGVFTIVVAAVAAAAAAAAICSAELSCAVLCCAVLC